MRLSQILNFFFITLSAAGPLWRDEPRLFARTVLFPNTTSISALLTGSIQIIPVENTLTATLSSITSFRESFTPSSMTQISTVSTSTLDTISKSSISNQVSQVSTTIPAASSQGSLSVSFQPLPTLVTSSSTSVNSPDTANSSSNAGRITSLSGQNSDQNSNPTVPTPLATTTTSLQFTDTSPRTSQHTSLTVFITTLTFSTTNSAVNITHLSSQKDSASVVVNTASTTQPTKFMETITSSSSSALPLISITTAVPVTTEPSNIPLATSISKTSTSDTGDLPGSTPSLISQTLVPSIAPTSALSYVTNTFNPTPETNKPPTALPSIVFSVLPSSIALAPTRITDLPISTQISAAQYAQNLAEAKGYYELFKTISASSPCTSGSVACISGEVGTCVGSLYSLTSCGTKQCFPLPMNTTAGVLLGCADVGMAESILGLPSSLSVTATAPFPTITPNVPISPTYTAIVEMTTTVHKTSTTVVYITNSKSTIGTILTIIPVDEGPERVTVTVTATVTTTEKV